MASDILYSVKMEKGLKKWGVDYYKNSVVSLCQPDVMTSLAKGYRYYINQFVPKKSGALRRSAHPVRKIGGEQGAGGNGTGSVSVYWGDRGKSTKYAHYQFVGDVYSPSKPVFLKNGNQTGWVSPKGKKKVPASPARKLGEGTPYTYTVHTGLVKTPMGYRLIKGDLEVTVKGYTTKGTGYNWLKLFKENKGDFGETAINIRAARYLYEASCVKSHIKPVGGRHIYNSWNQIKGRID